MLVGNLTREIELKHTAGGMAIAEIGLAVNDRVKKGDEWVDEATFVDCTAFGRTAEVASEYLSKGAPVLIEGRLKLDQWNDKNTGEKKSKMRVVVNKLQLLGSKKDAGGGDEPPRQRARATAAARPTDNFYQQAVETYQAKTTPPGDDDIIPF